MTDLINRLENAGGADRELDAEIAKALGASIRTTTINETRYQVFWPDRDEVLQGDDPDLLPELPAYTASLDTAIALVGEVLPGWKLGVREADEGFHVYLQGDENWKDAEGHHAVFAIAVCLAVLDGQALLKAKD